MQFKLSDSNENTLLNTTNNVFSSFSALNGNIKS